MSIPKDDHRAGMEGYLYAACPYCRMTLLQGKNGTDTFIKCSQCGRFIHVLIQDDAVIVKPKEM